MAGRPTGVNADIQQTPGCQSVLEQGEDDLFRPKESLQVLLMRNDRRGIKDLPVAFRQVHGSLRLKGRPRQLAAPPAVAEPIKQTYRPPAVVEPQAPAEVIFFGPMVLVFFPAHQKVKSRTPLPAQFQQQIKEVNFAGTQGSILRIKDRTEIIELATAPETDDDTYRLARQGHNIGSKMLRGRSPEKLLPGSEPALAPAGILVLVTTPGEILLLQRGEFGKTF